MALADGARPTPRCASRGGHGGPILERVETAEDAERLRFIGSPTILVDGRDPFAGVAAPFGLTCRVYRTPEGLAGSPTLDQQSASTGPPDHPEGGRFAR
jgi:hypothetical protein